jgi:hypothetical protein
VNDMIGSEGPLRSWTVLWHMEFIWLLPVLLVSVILVAAVEMLISNWRMRRSSVRPLSVGVRTPLGSAEPSPPAITQDYLYDGTPRIALVRIPRMLSP